MNRREAIAALLTGPIVAVRSLRAQASGLTSLSIAEAGRRIASRDITPLQLTNAYLERIAKMNPSLNAYVTVTSELARTEARAAAKRQSPMAGIPIAHKDLFETKGVRTTAGSRLFERHVPQANAAIVQQLEDAGAVLLGKTNTHELGGGVTTINPFYGTTRNPVDPSRIPGGSSGGSAAAVTAHLCAAATGSDTGGSVRIPAALCGCVGYKPTHGLFSTRGLIAASPTFDHVGFLTRTVEDAQIMTGINNAAIPKPRIAVARRFFFDDLDPAVAAAIDPIVSRYPDLDFPIDARTMSRVFDPVFSFEMWGRFGADWRANPGDFSKEMSAFFASPRPSIAEYEDGLAALLAYQAAVDALFDVVDVIITPTVAIAAPPIAGPIDGTKILRNTWPLNAAATPAVSIPLRGTPLPVGVQLIGRRNKDAELLAIARMLSDGVS